MQNWHSNLPLNAAKNNFYYKFMRPIVIWILEIDLSIFGGSVDAEHDKCYQFVQESTSNA